MSARDDAACDRAIAELYRAATGAGTWPRALDAVRLALGVVGDVPQALGPVTTRLLALHQGRPGPGDPSRSMADAVMTAFTPELLAECDVPDAEARDIAYRLGEHVCAALRIHERLRRVAAQATAGQALLQHLPCPVWLLDGDRFVHHANPAARAEQAAEAHAMLRDARLALCNEETDVQLTLRLRTLTDARHGSKAAIELHRSRGDTPAWLHLQTLQPEAVLGAFGTRPLVLATLFDPARSATPDPLALCGLCALTAAEARVAALLAEGLTAKEAARRLGNSPATVRSHQRQIFAKLGVPRTVDVVRVLRHGEALWARAGSGVSGHPCG